MLIVTESLRKSFLKYWRPHSDLAIHISIKGVELTLFFLGNERQKIIHDYCMWESKSVQIDSIHA